MLEGVSVCGLVQIRRDVSPRIDPRAPACNRWEAAKKATRKSGQTTDAATGVTASKNLKR